MLLSVGGSLTDLGSAREVALPTSPGPKTRSTRRPLSPQPAPRTRTHAHTHTHIRARTHTHTPPAARNTEQVPGPGGPEPQLGKGHPGLRAPPALPGRPPLTVPAPGGDASVSVPWLQGCQPPHHSLAPPMGGGLSFNSGSSHCCLGLLPRLLSLGPSQRQKRGAGGWGSSCACDTGDSWACPTAVLGGAGGVRGLLSSCGQGRTLVTSDALGHRGGAVFGKNRPRFRRARDLAGGSFPKTLSGRKVLILRPCRRLVCSEVLRPAQDRPPSSLSVRGEEGAIPLQAIPAAQSLTPQRGLHVLPTELSRAPQRDLALCKWQSRI